MKPPRERAKARVSLALLLAALAAALLDDRGSGTPAAFRVAPAERPSALDWSEADSFMVSSGGQPSVHSATAVEIGGGRIRAFWYGGSREGASDVAIYSAVFDPTSSRWGPEEIAVTREGTARDLGRYVRKLGNPVAGRDGRGRLWLFYVSVSIGGWSGSAVNFRISEDEGATFGPARRLVVSPLLNLGTLVRGPMLSFEDGTIGLPVYHELVGKFGEFLRISEEGRVLDKGRLSRGRTSLQPVVVPGSRLSAVAFLRSSGSSPPRVLSVATEDGGRSWSDLAPIELRNPDAAVSAIRAASGEILLAFNDSEIDRGNLKLAASRDGGETFEIVGAVAPPDGRDAQELAYPWLLQTKDGAVHLLYSWNRSRIVHARYRTSRAAEAP